MELSEVQNLILYTILTVILPVVATYVVNLIKVKIKESNIIFEKTKNQNLEDLVKGALTDVMDSVLYVNQTYVDTLKASDSFDKESQKLAFNKAYEKALYLISDNAKSAIEELYGSFEEWLETKIETSVNIAKKEL